jgi:glyoxylase-like metal-dependent hydrolase (beta-lactamase superfamily II)
MTILIDGAELWFAATNCYIVAPDRGGPAVVIDAPPDVDAIIALLAKHDLTPVALLVTHGHVDHVGGAGGAVARTGVAAYLHPDDDFLAAVFGIAMPGIEAFAPPERFIDLADGDRLNLAGLDFDVLHTPGHTPGHCCFLLRDEEFLFSGDQLFAGSIGRTDLPGGDFNTLMRSMETRVLTLPDDTAVLPGHGPTTTIGRERTTNPFILEFL